DRTKVAGLTCDVIHGLDLSASTPRFRSENLEPHTKRAIGRETRRGKRRPGPLHREPRGPHRGPHASTKLPADDPDKWPAQGQVAGNRRPEKRGPRVGDETAPHSAQRAHRTSCARVQVDLVDAAERGEAN